MDPLPQDAPHFFLDTSLDLLDEVPYALLVEISQLAQANGSVAAYESLQFAVRKLQWVKLAAARAVEIDRVLRAQPVDGYLLLDTVAQSEHAKSVLEVVSYGKAVTDAISHFLNERWALGHKERTCDIKWQVFRDSVAARHPTLAQFFAAHVDWLNKDSRTADSLPATRDEWLHRGVPGTALLWPPTEVGALPVLRSLSSLTGGLPPTATSASFMSTPEFVSHHLKNLVNLLLCILRVAISEERRTAPDLLVRNSGGPPVSFFLTRITQERAWVGMRLGPYTSRVHGSQ